MASVKVNGATFRVRVCLARDERTGKQVWRTATFQRPEGLTPKAEEKEIRRRADEWERQQRRDYEAGLDAHRDRVTLDAFTRGQWWQYIEGRGLSYNTYTNYKMLSENVRQYYGPRIRLIEISKERVDGFIRWLRVEKSLSDATVRMHFDVLRGILDYAVSCGYLESSPIDRMRQQDKPTVKHEEPDFLTVEEAKAFLDALDSDKDMPVLWKCYFQLLLFAGVRRGEGLALTWADYDTDRKELTISKSVTLTGRANAETVVKGTKTGRKRRVPVSDTLAAALETRRAEMVAQYGTCERSWYIFGEVEDPEKVQSPNRVYGRLARFQKKHGLRRTSVHLLRHSFASLALANGADLKAIQATLGHSRPSMTLMFYSGVSERQNRAAVEGVERAVKKSE